MRRLSSVRTSLTAGLCAATLVLAGCGGGESDAEDGARTLTFTMMVGEQTPIGELWAWWLDEIEEGTDGELAFDRFWDATLLKSTETMEGLNDGRADIGQVLPTVYAGQFPLTSVGELPFETSNAAAIAQALGTLGRDEDSALAEEWAGHSLVPLAWSVGASSALATNEPIETVEDLDGLRLRANDRGSRVLEPSGANLINIELAEIYGSMDRGLVDGIYGIPFSFSGPLKYPEVADHFTDLGIGISTVNGLAINEETWASLTPEQQEVITEVSSQVPGKIAEIEQRWDESSCEAVREAGDSVHVLSAEESAEIEQAGKADVLESWQSEVEDAGGDPDQFYAQYREELEAAEADHPTFQTGVQRCVDAG